MKITPLTVGQMSTNCYLVTDEETRKTLIIDPGDEGDFISTTLLEKNLLPQAVLLTHGHYDHCLAALELKLNFSLPIYLHRKDLFLYQKAHKAHTFWTCPVKGRGTAKRWKGSIPQLPPIDFYLTDHQILTFGDSSLKVIHIPGHTPGSVCFYSAPHLFVGDTIFENGVGRTDFSYSSLSDLKKSITKILSYPDNTLIYPGHEDYGLPLLAIPPHLFS